MTDQPNQPIAKELREAERFERVLDRLFAAMLPPDGARERLLAKLEGAFHESELTLNDAGPFSFQQAVADRDFETDLLAAGLEDDDYIDEDELDPDED